MATPRIRKNWNPGVKYDINVSDMMRRLEIYSRLAPQAAQKGMGAAVSQLLNDSIMRAPTVPLDKGTLRSTGGAYVDTVRVEKSNWPDTAPERGHRAAERSDDSSARFIVGAVGFNTPYAAKVHEYPHNFQEPGAGNFYLTEKLVTRHKLYIDIIAARLRGVR